MSDDEHPNEPPSPDDGPQEAVDWTKLEEAEHPEIPPEALTEGVDEAVDG